MPIWTDVLLHFNTTFALSLKRKVLAGFKELGVGKKFVQALADLNIVEPTDIQSRVIPLLLNSNTDLVGQAQTGTGKTAAYGLPLLHRINPSQNAVQGLILSPTRELGQQIAKQLFKFTRFTDKIFTEAVYGGSPIEKQIASLRRPTHIIVATPGRLIDLVKRKAVDLSHVKTVILDEADEMLSMGFKKELDEILSFLSSAENKWLFTATIPQGIKHIIKNHLSANAHRIEIKGKNVVNKNINHQFFICDDIDKPFILMQMLKSVKNERGIVFCRTKDAAKKLELQLSSKSVKCGAIHGDLLQKERDKVMRIFKKGSSDLLIATDIAARGIDIANLSFVVHYQLPDKDEYFVHRSGRTARAGKDGLSICLVNSKELKQIRFYEKSLGISFKQVKVYK